MVDNTTIGTLSVKVDTTDLAAAGAEFQKFQQQVQQSNQQINQSTNATQAAGQATSRLAQEVRQASGEASNMKGVWGQVEQIFQKSSGSIAGVASSFGGILRSSLSEVGSLFRSSTPSIASTAAELEHSSEAAHKMAEAGHILHPVLATMGVRFGELTSLTRLTHAGLLAVAGAVGGILLNEIEKAADAADKLKARLSGMAPSSDSAKAAFEGLQDTAKTTGIAADELNKSLEALLGTYKDFGKGYNVFPPTEGGDAARARLGGSVEDMQRITKTMAEMFRIAGVDGKTAGKAMEEFFQSIAKDGGLTIDALEKLKTAAPSIVQSVDPLAATLQKAFNFGDLEKRLSTGGPIQLQQFMQGLLRIGPQVDATFAKLPESIDMAAGKMKNAWDSLFEKFGRTQIPQQVLDGVSAALLGWAGSVEDVGPKIHETIDKAIEDFHRFSDTVGVIGPTIKLAILAMVPAQWKPLVGLMEFKGELDAFAKDAGANADQIDKLNKVLDALAVALAAIAGFRAGGILGAIAAAGTTAALIYGPEYLKKSEEVGKAVGEGVSSDAGVPLVSKLLPESVQPTAPTQLQKAPKLDIVPPQPPTEDLIPQPAPYPFGVGSVQPTDGASLGSMVSPFSKGRPLYPLVMPHYGLDDLGAPSEPPEDLGFPESLLQGGTGSTLPRLPAPTTIPPAQQQDSGSFLQKLLDSLKGGFSSIPAPEEAIPNMFKGLLNQRSPAPAGAEELKIQQAPETFNKLNSTIEKADESTDTLNQTFNEFQGSTTKAKESTSELTTSFSSTAEAVKELSGGTSSISEISTSLKSLSGDTGSASSAIDTLDSGMKTATSSVSTLNSDITQLGSAATTAAGAITSAASSIASAAAQASQASSTSTSQTQAPASEPTATAPTVDVGGQQEGGDYQVPSNIGSGPDSIQLSGMVSPGEKISFTPPGGDDDDGPGAFMQPLAPKDPWAAFKAAQEHQQRWGMPGVGAQLGDIASKTAQMVTAPLMAGPELMGRFAQGELSSSDPEAVQRSADTALGLVGGGAFGAEKGALGIFGGAGAKTADLTALAQAKQMAVSGADRKAVWDATGWFQGSEGKWRFEIPDTKSRVNFGIEAEPPTFAGDFLHHPEFFEAYPDIAKNTPVMPSLHGSPQGAFDPNTGAITLASPRNSLGEFTDDWSSTHRTLLHELQHAVQQKEGFEFGGSPKAPDVEEFTKSLLRAPGLKDKLVESGIVDKIPDNVTSSDIYNNLLHQTYEKLAGEVEARNVSRRAPYQPDLLKLSPPWETEDIPASEQLGRTQAFVYHGEGGGSVLSAGRESPELTESASAEAKSGVTAYHGTTAPYEGMPAAPPPKSWDLLDRMLGPHYASDPDVANSFVMGRSNEADGPKEGGRMFKATLPEDKKFLPIDQPLFDWATPNPAKPWANRPSDQSVVEQMVMKEAFKKDPSILDRYLQEARRVPAEQSSQLAVGLVSGEKVDLPLDGPHDLEKFVRNFGGRPYNEADRQLSVDLARKSWQDQGYSGLKYINTAPMEMEKAKDPTSYILFNPKEAKPSWAADAPKTEGAVPSGPMDAKDTASSQALAVDTVGTGESITPTSTEDDVKPSQALDIGDNQQGGTYQVPNFGGGDDSVPLQGMVSPGETISVTPASQKLAQTMTHQAPGPDPARPYLDIVDKLAAKLNDAIMVGPKLMGDVVEGRIDAASTEAVQRAVPAALSVVGYGSFGAEIGAGQAANSLAGGTLRKWGNDAMWRRIGDPVPSEEDAAPEDESAIPRPPVTPHGADPWAAFKAAAQHQQQWGMPDASSQVQDAISKIVGGAVKAAASPITGGADLMQKMVGGELSSADPEAIRRSTDVVGGLAGYGVMGAEKGALGAFGGQGFNVYHGSPHDFPKFDMSKLGTGEGASNPQWIGEYGHGMYFSTSEDVAKWYRNQYSDVKLTTPTGADIPTSPKEKSLLSMLKEGHSGDIEDMLRNVKLLDESQLPHGVEPWAAFKDAQERQQQLGMGSLAKWAEMGAVPKSMGHMYEANIKADPEHFLDLDNTIMEQSDHVKRAVAKIGLDPMLSGNITGYDLLQRMQGGAGGYSGSYASNKLMQAGIPGTTYTGETSGQRNYVVFDDKLIDIVRKYGLAGMGITGAGAAAGLFGEAGQAQAKPLSDPTNLGGSLSKTGTSTDKLNQTNETTTANVDKLSTATEKVSTSTDKLSQTNEETATNTDKLSTATEKASTETDQLTQGITQLGDKASVPQTSLDELSKSLGGVDTAVAPLSGVLDGLAQAATSAAATIASAAASAASSAAAAASSAASSGDGGGDGGVQPGIQIGAQRSGGIYVVGGSGAPDSIQFSGHMSPGETMAILPPGALNSGLLTDIQNALGGVEISMLTQSGKAPTGPSTAVKGQHGALVTAAGATDVTASTSPGETVIVLPVESAASGSLLTKIQAAIGQSPMQIGQPAGFPSSTASALQKEVTQPITPDVSHVNYLPGTNIPIGTVLSYQDWLMHYRSLPPPTLSQFGTVSSIYQPGTQNQYPAVSWGVAPGGEGVHNLSDIGTRDAFQVGAVKGGPSAGAAPPESRAAGQSAVSALDNYYYPTATSGAGGTPHWTPMQASNPGGYGISNAPGAPPGSIPIWSSGGDTGWYGGVKLKPSDIPDVGGGVAPTTDQLPSNTYGTFIDPQTGESIYSGWSPEQMGLGGAGDVPSAFDFGGGGLPSLPPLPSLPSDVTAPNFPQTTTDLGPSYDPGSLDQALQDLGSSGPIDDSSAIDLGGNQTGGLYMISNTGGGADSISLQAAVSPGETLAILPQSALTPEVLSTLQDAIGKSPVTISGNSQGSVAINRNVSGIPITDTAPSSTSDQGPLPAQGFVPGTPSVPSWLLSPPGTISTPIGPLSAPGWLDTKNGPIYDPNYLLANVNMNQPMPDWLNLPPGYVNTGAGVVSAPGWVDTSSGPIYDPSFQLFGQQTKIAIPGYVQPGSEASRVATETSDFTQLSNAIFARQVHLAQAYSAQQQQQQEQATPQQPSSGGGVSVKPDQPKKGQAGGPPPSQEAAPRAGASYTGLGGLGSTPVTYSSGPSQPTAPASSSYAPFYTSPQFFDPLGLAQSQGQLDTFPPGATDIGPVPSDWMSPGGQLLPWPDSTPTYDTSIPTPYTDPSLGPYPSFDSSGQYSTPGYSSPYTDYTPSTDSASTDYSFADSQTGNIIKIPNSGGTADSVSLQGMVSPGEVVAIIPSHVATEELLGVLQAAIGKSPVTLGQDGASTSTARLSLSSPQPETSIGGGLTAPIVDLPGTVSPTTSSASSSPYTLTPGSMGLPFTINPAAITTVPSGTAGTSGASSGFGPFVPPSVSAGGDSGLSPYLQNLAAVAQMEANFNAQWAQVNANAGFGYGIPPKRSPSAGYQPPGYSNIIQYGPTMTYGSNVQYGTGYFQTGGIIKIPNSGGNPDSVGLQSMVSPGEVVAIIPSHAATEELLGLLQAAIGKAPVTLGQALSGMSNSSVSRESLSANLMMAPQQEPSMFGGGLLGPIVSLPGTAPASSSAGASPAYTLTPGSMGLPFTINPAATTTVPSGTSGAPGTSGTSSSSNPWAGMGPNPEWGQPLVAYSPGSSTPSGSSGSSSGFGPFVPPSIPTGGAYGGGFTGIYTPAAPYNPFPNPYAPGGTLAGYAAPSYGSGVFQSGGIVKIPNSGGSSDSVNFQGTVSPGEVVAAIPSHIATDELMGTLQAAIGKSPITASQTGTEAVSTPASSEATPPLGTFAEGGTFMVPPEVSRITAGMELHAGEKVDITPANKSKIGPTSPDSMGDYHLHVHGVADVNQFAAVSRSAKVRRAAGTLFGR